MHRLFPVREIPLRHCPGRFLRPPLRARPQASFDRLEGKSVSVNADVPATAVRQDPFALAFACLEGRADVLAETGRGEGLGWLLADA